MAEWRAEHAYRDVLATRRDTVLAYFAERRFGVVARWQLVEAGLTRGVIARLLTSRRLVRIYDEVYAIGHRQLRPEGHRLAAVLAGGPGAVLSHRSSAEALGLLADRRTRADITLPPGHARGRRQAGLVVHRSRLAEADRTEVDGIPCTSVARTLVDIAGSGPRRHIERAVDQALVIQVYDQGAIDEIRPPRRGVGVLRRVLEQRHPDSHLARSELERRALKRLDATGIPRPEVNVWLADPSAEVDLLWPDEGLCVELDGRRYHAHRRAQDRARDARVEATGRQVLRFGWGDVTSGPFPDDVRRALLLRRVAR